MVTIRKLPMNRTCPKVGVPRTYRMPVLPPIGQLSEHQRQLKDHAHSPNVFIQEIGIIRDTGGASRFVVTLPFR